ncbi:hypothetical protein ACFVFT_21095 [Streptomyces tendae]|uniref:hypothetical protein n=1 Tax=Streptomyces tendae TaxID=1932 RepID=UPI0036B27A2E
MWALLGVGVVDVDDDAGGMATVVGRERPGVVAVAVVLDETAVDRRATRTGAGPGGLATRAESVIGC